MADATAPLRCVSVEAHLIGFRRVNPFEADLGFADGESVAVYDPGNSTDRLSGMGMTNEGESNQAPDHFANISFDVRAFSSAPP